MNQKQCQKCILVYSISDLIQILPCDSSHYELRPVPPNLKTSSYTRGTQSITKIVSPKTKIIPILIKVPVLIYTVEIMMYVQIRCCILNECIHVVEVCVKRTNVEMYTIIRII